MAEKKTPETEAELTEVLRVRREKLAQLVEDGKDPFQITKFDVTHHSAEIKDDFDALEGKEVVVAGRMMSKRVMGKASFCNVQDLKGGIQCYVARDAVGEDSYKDFKKFDIGDIIGVRGEVFKTKTGEISIHASAVTLLSKSLQVLPEKFHGLTNTDMRYRQRYVDLIVNPEVKDTFVKRSKIIKEIRNFLDGRGFMEVETPMLVSNAGGAAARPFETHYNALNEDVKLRISLELYLKRLIVGGLENKISTAIFSNRTKYDINKCINSCVKNQVVIQRCTQVQNHDNERNADNRMHCLHDFSQLFLRNHIGKNGGKPHSQEHKV